MIYVVSGFRLYKVDTVLHMSVKNGCILDLCRLFLNLTQNLDLGEVSPTKSRALLILMVSLKPILDLHLALKFNILSEMIVI